MNALGQALPRPGSPGRRAANMRPRSLQLASVYPFSKPDSPVTLERDLSLDIPAEVDQLSLKMDWIGQGQDKARSAAVAPSGDGVGGARRSRATLPANFRLTFDPNSAGQQFGRTGSSGAAGAASRAAVGGASAIGVIPPRASAGAGAAASSSLAGAGPAASMAPRPAAAFGGGGISLPEAGSGRRGMSIKERIQEEEEEMAINMSLHGNPFGPRVVDQRALTTFDWLAGENEIADPFGGPAARSGPAAAGPLAAAAPF